MLEQPIFQINNQSDRMTQFSSFQRHKSFINNRYQV